MPTQTKKRGSARKAVQLDKAALLDIRDAIHTIGEAPSAQGALDKLQALRKLTRL